MRRGVANTLLAIASVAVTLGVLELGLALFHPIQFSIEKNMYFEPDPHTGYRLKPNGKGMFGGGIPANTNSFGHRSDEIEPFKGPGVVRILVLGDSYTVGASVEQSETYASVLQELLNRAEGASRRFEVINAGVGGWSPFQYAQYYEHYGPELEPDMVVVGLFVGNDVDRPIENVEQLQTAVMGRRISREAAGNPLVWLRVWLHENSHLGRLVFRQSRPPFSYRRESCDELPAFLIRIERGRRDIHLKDSDRLAARVSGAVRQIERIQTLTAQAGIPLLVLVFPDENQLNPTLQELVFHEPDLYDLELPQSLLKARFEEAGIESLDLRPALLADDRCLFQNDTHWIPEGHRVVAEAVYPAVASRLASGAGDRPLDSGSEDRPPRVHPGPR